MRRSLLAVALLSLVLPAAAFAWGGTYATGDAYGTSVAIQVSDAYPVDDTLPQSWATFLGTLVHGPELGTLRLDLEPMAEIGTICGSSALACYDPGHHTIYADPTDELDQPPAHEIVTHEYGHHIANSRSDAPFLAENYGTKRWSSYEEICKKTGQGKAFPGDEQANYELNPGEAFAESYRVLNLTKAGDTSIGWDVVARSFYPDATALRLLEEDVTDPWTGNTVTHVHGSFGVGSVRTIGLQTTLDGTLTLHLHAPSTSQMRLALYFGNALVAHGRASIHFVICGQRALRVEVERTSGSGPFTVDVSKP